MNHHHADERSYLAEQVSTLIICAMLGGVSIMLYAQNQLRFILAPKFFLPVLLGGIAILVLVAVRTIALLGGRGRVSQTGPHDHDHDCCCDHDHDHGHHHEEMATVALELAPEHSHAHENHDHHHDHGHDHGWQPWRYIALLLPIVLYGLNLPNAGFTASGRIGGDFDPLQAEGKYVAHTGLQIGKKKGSDMIEVLSVVRDSPAEKAEIAAGDLIEQMTPVSGDGESVSLKGLSVDEAAKKLRGEAGSKVRLRIRSEATSEPREVELTRASDVIDVTFGEMATFAYSPERRQAFQGRTARMVGQFAGSDPNNFDLVRVKITCCAADAIPLGVKVMRDPSLKHDLEKLPANAWVKVTGRLQFGKRKDRDEYVTLLMVSSPKDVQQVAAPADPYIQ
jgi:hypothetical protein